MVGLSGWAERRRKGDGAGPVLARVRGLPFIGSSIGLARDPLGFLERVACRGDVVEFGMLGDRVILFNHPDAIEELLVGKRDKLVKDRFTRELSIGLGKGLLVSEGAFWRKQRRLVQPAFHRQRIEAYAAVMVEYTERAIASWRDGETRSTHEDMMRLTLDIVARTLFSVDIGEVARKIGWAIELLMHRFSGFGAAIPYELPTPANYRARRAIATLDEIVYGIIRERRRSGEDTGDLLSMLLAATSEDGGGMDDEQVRDESVTLLLAGHETTALALTYAFHLLGKNPHAYDRLRQEIDEVVGDRSATSADVPKLRWADAIIREAMRLYPPAWAVGREAIAPCRIAGIDIPEGTQLWASQWTVHRDARWFPEPLAFRPERWAGDLAKHLPRFAYFPFGGGPRICIGNAFAMMEAVLILVTIARRFTLLPADRRPLHLVPSITVRPKGAVRMIVAKRAGR